ACDTNEFTSASASSGACVANMRSITERTASAERRISARRGVTSSSINSRTRWSRDGSLESVIKVHQERSVVGRELAFAGVAIDERVTDRVREWPRRQHQVDAHAAALVEVAGAVVPPGEQAI